MIKRLFASDLNGKDVAVDWFPPTNVLVTTSEKIFPEPEKDAPNDKDPNTCTEHSCYYVPVEFVCTLKTWASFPSCFC